MKINGKTPQEINEGLKRVNEWLAIVELASKQANLEMEKLFPKKPKLRVIK